MHRCYDIALFVSGHRSSSGASQIGFIIIELQNKYGSMFHYQSVIKYYEVKVIYNEI